MSVFATWMVEGMWTLGKGSKGEGNVLRTNHRPGFILFDFHNSSMRWVLFPYSANKENTWTVSKVIPRGNGYVKTSNQICSTTYPGFSKVDQLLPSWVGIWELKPTCSRQWAASGWLCEIEWVFKPLSPFPHRWRCQENPTSQDYCDSYA
jgi:hypothetical protein